MIKKNSTRLRAAAAFAVTLMILATAAARTSTASQAQNGQNKTAPPQNIYFTALEAGNFNTFIKAVKAAGMVDTLKGTGPFTVFVPTDEAFAKLSPQAQEDLFRPENREKLKEILAGHIFPVRAAVAEITKLSDAKTLRRDSLKIETDGGVKVGGASVTQPDIIASNGVIHGIDTVLLTAGN